MAINLKSRTGLSTGQPCKKFNKLKEEKEYKKLDDIHDLVTIRIVFCFESDKKRFVSTLYKELTTRNLL